MNKLAQIASSHYLVDKHDRNTAKTKIAKRIDDTGFKLVSLHRGVATFDDDNSRVISIKGTNPMNLKDLKSDIVLAAGLQENDPQFIERTKQVRAMLTKDKPVTIVGHSLGGSIATHMLTKDKPIRDSIQDAVLFNTGYSKPFHDSLKVGLTREAYDTLKSKITHHHIKGDLISQALERKAIGTVVSHDTDISPHGIENFLGLE
jgi:hypothetical protein